jgi:ABC-type glycerol-3-phosphate transport system substrate-binding protein
MNKKLYLGFALMIVLSMILAACASPTAAPAPQQPQTIIQTVEVEKQVDVVRTVEVEVERIVEVTPTPRAKSPGEKTLIVWWSHWANEPAKRAVIEKVVADYEAENQDVDIVLTWWDKNPLRDAIRSTMTAGTGAPDITTFDSEVVEWVGAGWLMDLSDTLPWENFIEGVRTDGSYPNLGFPGNYKLNLSVVTHMLLYNPDIFAELGIVVPENRQFTQSEFVDVVKKCNAAGYAGIANAIGNRPAPGTWPALYAMLNLVGAEKFEQYHNGTTSWDTSEARQVLNWTAELSKNGFLPASYATMTIDEFHVYFHTQQKACMFYIPTWYTGRSFKSQTEGGQDPNWHFGMLRYPLMDGAAAPNSYWAGFESGYAALSSSQNPDVAKDILRFLAQPKYGALWTAVTNSPSSIKYDMAKDWPSKETLEMLGQKAGTWDWYWEEYNNVYAQMTSALIAPLRCGDFEAAAVAVLNEGHPQGLVDTEEAIKMLDAALCK